MVKPLFGAGASTDIDALGAVAEAAAEATTEFGFEPPNLVLALISSDHRDGAEDVAAFLGERFPGAAVIGCTADGVIGGGVEFEHGPAVAVFAAFLPDTVVSPFGLRFLEDAAGDPVYEGWPQHLPPDSTLVVLSDRHSFPSGHLLEMLNQTRPGTLVAGGIATGGEQAGDTRLFYGGKVFTEGAVGVAVSGRFRVKTLVAQGCRPIGDPATVTRADRNMIFEIAGESPIERIRRIWSKADPRERSLMQAGLKIGRVVDEYKNEFGPGDFLIRPVTGADAEGGFIAVGDVVEIGQTVQFHIQDPETADTDLTAALQSVHDASGALLFTCNGRGTNLFPEPHHDAMSVRRWLDVPTVGMFCAGEMGPVGGRNFLHGLSASLALFCDSGG